MGALSKGPEPCESRLKKVWVMSMCAQPTRALQGLVWQLPLVRPPPEKPLVHTQLCAPFFANLELEGTTCVAGPPLVILVLLPTDLKNFKSCCQDSLSAHRPPLHDDLLVVRPAANRPSS